MNTVQELSGFWFENARSGCGICGSRAPCLPAGLHARERERLEALITVSHRVRRGSYLCRAGTDMQFLFAVRSGSLKSCVIDNDGREQIMGFHLARELLGLDAIGDGKHVCDVIALEDSEICKIPFVELQQLSREIPALGHNLHCMLSQEIGRGYGVMLLLGSMRADERIASFLLNLSHRFLARGYSPSQFILRMSRNDIGSYLGLQLETVSRMFSRFHREGIIAVRGREIRIIKVDRLKDIMRDIAADPGGSHAALRDTVNTAWSPQPRRVAAASASASAVGV